MCAQFDTQLPQGFSVFQPMLGAPLQFFPALGTKELDDMLDAYVVGPASVKEKRATVSVDFLEYAQRTGQTFKFYAVPGLMAPVESPTSASSINASPVASSWDWSAVSAPTPSARPAKASRAASTASSRRSAPTDFSHLPGMKILTKEGLDVTNSASRGSKTKEQRDHAHLMRIIKACDSCKKKKIRCDPSHKKRSAAPQPAKVTKKQTRAPQPTAVAVPQTESFPDTPTFGMDSTFASPEFESLDVDNMMKEPWEDLIQFPAEDDANYDFFLDPQGFFSQPLDQQAISSSSESPFSWSDEQFNAYSSSSDQGVIHSNSASTSPSTLSLDTNTLPPDLSQSLVPLNPSDFYTQPQAESVAMPDLHQPESVDGSGQVYYATSLWQSPADVAESQSSSSTDVSRSMNVSPLGSTSSVTSSPVERLENRFVAPQELSNAPPGEDSRTLQSLSENSVLQTLGDSSLAVSSSDILSRRGLAHVDESEVHRSTGAPLSARTLVSDGRTMDSAVAADWFNDGTITGTDCIITATDEPATGTESSIAPRIIAPRNEPVTGTDCPEGVALQAPLEPISTMAEESALATPLQPESANAQLDALPRLGNLSGQTSSSLVLASATLYGALDMLLAKQQKKSILDKGRRKASFVGSSWLGMCGKLAIIPLATVLATGFLPVWSFVG